MSPYEKRLYYEYLAVALMILVAVALITWMNTGCSSGNC
jgi:hypothetical protein